MLRRSAGSTAGTGSLMENHGNGLSAVPSIVRSEEHTSELQSRLHLVCRLLLEKKKNKKKSIVGPVRGRRLRGRVCEVWLRTSLVYCLVMKIAGSADAPVMSLVCHRLACEAQAS